MRKKLSIILLVICVFFCIGCKTKDISRQNVYGNGNGFFAKEGFVLSGTPVEFVDALSNKTFIACSILNCEHIEGSEECEAMLEDSNYVYTIIFDGKMYYLQHAEDYTTNLWVKELAGSGRSKVATIPYSFEKRQFVLNDGKLYFGAKEGIGEDKLKESLPFLVELDLNTYECRKLTEPEAYEDYSFQKLDILDGSLYYVYYAYLEDYFKVYQEAVTGDNILEDLEKAEELRHVQICKVDLDTLEKTSLFTGDEFERYEFYGVSGEYLVFFDTKEQSIVRMTSDGEKKVLKQFTGVRYLEFGINEVLFGDYISYTEADKKVFISIQDEKKVERSIKENEPGIFLYNKAIDSVLVIGNNSGSDKFYIMTVEDYIAGDF